MEADLDTPEKVLAFIASLARTTASLSRDEQRLANKLGEVAKEVCRQTTASLIVRADGDPILQTCGADGTPITISETVFCSCLRG